MHRVVSAVLLMVALCVVRPAQAAPPAPTEDEIARARSHYEAGRALYNLERYSEARAEFAAGYALKRDPRFLINLGQCYRKLGELDKAKATFQQFLDAVPPDDHYRPQVRGLIDELDREIAARPPPPPPPPTPTPTPAPTPSVTPASVVVATPPPPRRSFVKRHWWIFPVGAVVLAGVGVGLYFALRPPTVDCGSVSFGCIYPPSN